MNSLRFLVLIGLTTASLQAAAANNREISKEQAIAQVIQMVLSRAMKNNRAITPEIINFANEHAPRVKNMPLVSSENLGNEGYSKFELKEGNVTIECSIMPLIDPYVRITYAAIDRGLVDRIEAELGNFYTVIRKSDTPFERINGIDYNVQTFALNPRP